MNILKTKLQRGNPERLRLFRTLRIQEALNFESGSFENKKKHVIYSFNDEFQASFEKPGKESFRQKNPNLNDMTPVISSSTERFTFDDMWSYLIELALHDYNLFKQALVILYRLAYMLDHKKTDNKIRFMPDSSILKITDSIQAPIPYSYTFRELLYFFDLLGWNEDVKYNVNNGKPEIRANYKTGSINTILSLIAVPFICQEFIEHIISKTKRKEKIETRKIVNAIQKISKQRGVYTPRQKDLIAWLSPYLYEE